MRASPIKVSSADYRKLLSLLNSARLDPRVSAQGLNDLEAELSRAAVVGPSEMPADVVTMNSTVWFRDLDSDEIEKYTLVYPSDADVVQDRISVLAPVGTALLGYRIGDIVHWRVPLGERRFEIVDVVQSSPRAPLEGHHSVNHDSLVA